MTDPNRPDLIREIDSLFADRLSHSEPLKELAAETFFGKKNGYLVKDGNVFGLNVSCLGMNTDVLDELINLLGLHKCALRLLLANDNNITNTQNLKNLTDIEHIELSWNRISEASFINYCPKLRVCLLNNNEISTFDVHSTKIMTPVKNGINDFKEGIYLHDNPLLEPPPEAFIDGFLSAKFLDPGDTDWEERRELRLILIGSGGAGKTSLANRILGRVVDANEPATKNISIYQKDFGNTESQIWDFAGQESMMSIHRFFLAERSLYLIVLDCRREEQADRILDYVQSFAPNAPIVIILNKIDENEFHDLNRARLHKRYPNIVGIYRVSCATMEGVGEFNNSISEIVESDQRAAITIPKTWRAAKTAISQQLVKYMSARDCFRILNETGIPSDEHEEFLSFSHNVGFLFRANIPTEDIVCSPRWLVETVYPLLSATELGKCGAFDVTSTDATVRLVQLRECVENIYRDRAHDANWTDVRVAIELMEKFELCVMHSSNMFIPDLLGKNSIEEKGGDDPKTTLIWKYSTLPRYLVHKYHIRFADLVFKNKRWLTGMSIRDGAFDSDASIEMDEIKNEIHVHVYGREHRNFLKVIRNRVNELNEDLGFEDVTEGVDLGEGFFVEVAELEGLLRMGQSTYYAGKLQKKLQITEILESHTYNFEGDSKVIDKLVMAERKLKLMEKLHGQDKDMKG